MTIDSLRKDIDETDRQIVFLLTKRFDIAKQIGDIKKENNIPVIDTERETEILNNVKKSAKIRERDIVELYKIILKISKKQQGERA